MIFYVLTILLIFAPFGQSSKKNSSTPYGKIVNVRVYPHPETNNAKMNTETITKEMKADAIFISKYIKGIPVIKYMEPSKDEVGLSSFMSKRSHEIPMTRLPNHLTEKARNDVNKHKRTSQIRPIIKNGATLDYPKPQNHSDRDVFKTPSYIRVYPPSSSTTLQNFQNHPGIPDNSNYLKETGRQFTLMNEHNQPPQNLLGVGKVPLSRRPDVYKDELPPIPSTSLDKISLSDKISPKSPSNTHVHTYNGRVSNPPSNTNNENKLEPEKSSIQIVSLKSSIISGEKSGEDKSHENFPKDCESLLEENSGNGNFPPEIDLKSYGFSNNVPFTQSNNEDPTPNKTSQITDLIRNECELVQEPNNQVPITDKVAPTGPSSSSSASNKVEPELGHNLTRKRVRKGRPIRSLPPNNTPLNIVN